ncbi:MAG: vitamin K-dependent gamma-carboxylase [Gammaproteobacteria bacterium]|nr:MAG: vitamin K-dependent gamma-carboxylase [Gammaproteobacteria bacterium]PIE36538.1 MAG: vitamin K-dependent gamma-carboxylase [Gammaproteobacteria bacterium]
MSFRRIIDHLLFREVDAASLAAWRIGFGALMTFEAINYGLFLCLDCYYRDTSFLFKYHHFEWVGVPPGFGLEILFALMTVAGLCITVGYHYRAAMIFYTFGFTWNFLLDQTRYLNHFYLVILICVIMCFVPAHRYWSLDAWRKPELRSPTVPNWGRFWLGAQLEIVLIYAGLVKINGDWLNLEPMRLWMNYRSADAHWIFQWLTQDWGIALASYGVIALHLIGAPLLLWRRSRLAVLCLYAIFHTTNAFVFNIGIFPWMTLYASLLLFDPDWPRQFIAWANRHGWLMRWQHLAAAPTPRPASAGAADGTAAGLSTTGSAATLRRGAGFGTWQKTAITVFVFGWLAWQIVLPLRHTWAPGNVAWNEDGHRYAWRMKLRSKRGSAVFIVERADGRTFRVDPRDQLTARQARKMACIPDLIWQFAQKLEQDYARFELPEGAEPLDSVVRVETRCSLNARDYATLIDPTVDLSAIDRRHPASEWVLPNTLPRHEPIFGP